MAARKKKPTPQKSIEELIDASSLGTPGAKALRAQTPKAVVDKVLARADEIDRARLIREVTLDSRRLITIEPTDEEWRLTAPAAFDCPGAIVRLKPPADVTEDQVRQLVVSLREGGAMAVKVLPAEPSKQAMPTTEPAPAAASAREVVKQLVAALGTSERPAVGELVEQVMAEEGL